MKRVLFAAYGGGHVRSLLPVALRLRGRNDVCLEFLPLTTARLAVEQAGLPSLAYPDLLTCLDQTRANNLLERAGLTTPMEGLHSAISIEETLAYHAVGLHDLALLYGDEQALALFAQQGRAAFCPVHTFRSWLQYTQPDLVVTSSSPRSELALQRSARQLGIPGLVVSDLYLQRESAYMCDGSYATQITVINDYVAASLRARGLSDDVIIHVTGNPAFDSLFDDAPRMAGYALRSRLGLAADSLLLSYYAPPTSVSLLGEAFEPLSAVVAALEQISTALSHVHYLIRLHPNDIRPAPELGRRGFYCAPGDSLEACLWASNAVLVENSTVGYQAGLLGLPVFKLGNPTYPPYVECGIAKHLQGLEDLQSHLPSVPTGRHARVLMTQASAPATDAVFQVIDRLLA